MRYAHNAHHHPVGQRQFDRDAITFSTPIQWGPTSAHLSTFTLTNPLWLLIRTADFTNTVRRNLSVESRDSVINLRVTFWWRQRTRALAEIV